MPYRSVRGCWRYGSTVRADEALAGALVTYGNTWYGPTGLGPPPIASSALLYELQSALHSTSCPHSLALPSPPPRPVLHPQTVLLAANSFFPVQLLIHLPLSSGPTSAVRFRDPAALTPGVPVALFFVHSFALDFIDICKNTTTDGPHDRLTKRFSLHASFWLIALPLKSIVFPSERRWKLTPELGTSSLRSSCFSI